MKKLIYSAKEKLSRYKWLWTEKDTKIHLNLWQSLLLQFTLAVLAEIFIEACSRHSLQSALQFADQSTHAFLYNVLLIFMTTLPVFLIRRRRLYLIFVYVIWMCGGIANGVVLSGRVTPFTGPDLKNYSEALGVIDKYLDKFEIALLGVAVFFAVIWLLTYFFRCPKYKGKIPYIRTIVLIAAAFAGFKVVTDLSISSNYLSSYFGNIAFAYEDYGFPYCFTTTLLNTGVSKPNNYSEESIQAILAESNDLPETTADTDDLPNVIVVQLESFFDVSRVNYLTTSEDPQSYWHYLQENYSSGYYTVPSIGAGTANTEFETLTGMSMHFFGAGEYPFKGVLKTQVCESSAYVFKSLGYSCFGLHDNEANFYSRKTVYRNLGFDAFVSEEYMLNQDDVNENGWMRDDNLIAPIISCLDSTEGQDYVFTVSVQPHGSYPTEEVLEDPVITVDGIMTEEQKYQWEYYVNQCYEEDQFIENLINAVNERGEDTIIFFYGDHLPTLGLENNQLTGGNTYQTEWVMWNNFGLEQNDADICAYQALARIFDTLDIHEGTLFRYQQSHTGNEQDYNAGLQALQYDLLYGERYVYADQSDDEKLSTNPDYHLGLYKAAVTGFEEGPEGTVYIYGDNFTQSCKVFINKTMKETTFINEHTLLITGTDLEVTDKIRVGVQSNSKTHKILSYSKYYYVTYNQLYPDGEESVKEAAESAEEEEEIVDLSEDEDEDGEE